MGKNNPTADQIKKDIEQALKTVYDPEFPMVDIYTLGLIYEINVDETERNAHIVMSFTTPTCPMADYLIESVKNATLLVVPDREVLVDVSFEPMWSPNMIRDEDLQRMFDL